MRDSMNNPFHQTKSERLIRSIKHNIDRLINGIHGLYLQTFKIKLNKRVFYSEGYACEIEYRDKKGKLVGFWAYGSWHGDFPYHGQY
jgi:hypothetical protein